MSPKLIDGLSSDSGAPPKEDDIDVDNWADPDRNMCRKSGEQDDSERDGPIGAILSCPTPTPNRCEVASVCYREVARRVLELDVSDPPTVHESNVFIV